MTRKKKQVWDDEWEDALQSHGRKPRGKKHRRPRREDIESEFAFAPSEPGRPKAKRPRDKMPADSFDTDELDENPDILDEDELVRPLEPDERDNFYSDDVTSSPAFDEYGSPHFGDDDWD